MCAKRLSCSLNKKISWAWVLVTLYLTSNAIFDISESINIELSVTPFFFLYFLFCFNPEDVASYHDMLKQRIGQFGQ